MPVDKTRCNKCITGPGTCSECKEGWDLFDGNCVTASEANMVPAANFWTFLISIAWVYLVIACLMIICCCTFILCLM